MQNIVIQDMTQAIDDFDSYNYPRKGLHTKLMLDLETGEAWTDQLVGNNWKEYNDKSVFSLSDYMLMDGEYIRRDTAIEALREEDKEIPEELESYDGTSVITEKTATKVALHLCRNWKNGIKDAFKTKWENPTAAV